MGGYRQGLTLAAVWRWCFSSFLFFFANLYPLSSFPHKYLNQLPTCQVGPARILPWSTLSDWLMCAVSFCRDAPLPFPFSHVGIWYQEQAFRSVPPAGGDVLTSEVKWSEGSHPCLSLRSRFLSHSWMFAKEAFWFNYSLLDYVIMAFEFFIRSFLSWSLGLGGTCFLAFDVFEKSSYLYHSSFALILWLLLWGPFWCAELSFACVCCMGCLCGLFLYTARINPPASIFANCHESRRLLTSSFGKLVFAESYTENWVFYEKHSTFAWRGWVALQSGIAAMLQFPLSPFLLCLEKHLIIIVHLSK